MKNIVHGGGNYLLKKELHIAIIGEGSMGCSLSCVKKMLVPWEEQRVEKWTAAKEGAC